MTQFLRFPDESAWLAAAAEAGFITDDTLVAYTHDRAIDVVGEIVGMAGFHVNYSGVLPTGWGEFVVAPEQPYRVFA
jgi:methylmalonyl-CoA mutase cobalamin-binding subunit